MNERERAITNLMAVDLSGGSHEMLSSIAKAIYKPTCGGWTIGACQVLRDTLVNLLSETDEEALREAYTKGREDGFDCGFASADDWLGQHEDAMNKHGWVKLPKDADGEYIHIGDVMEGVDKYNSLREVTGRVTTVSFEADGLIEVAVQARNDDGKTWRRAYLDPCASLYCHHHEPTVEDVLRDYASRILIAGCIDEEDTLVAEYADKLQLRGDAE